MQKKQKTVLTPYLLILPAVLFIGCVMIYPLCKVFYLAFQNYNPTMPFLNGFCGIDKTLKAEFRHNPDTFIWGQDVANKEKGGVFNITIQGMFIGV